MALADAVTAIVLLKPRGGLPNEPPSTRNLEQWEPAPGNLEAAVEGFRAAGFHAHGAGNSLQIEGPAALFERFFGVKLREHREGTIQREREDGTRTSTLPLNKVPSPLRKLIHAASFSEPPDFGPSDFA